MQGLSGFSPEFLEGTDFSLLLCSDCSANLTITTTGSDVVNKEAD